MHGMEQQWWFNFLTSDGSNYSLTIPAASLNNAVQQANMHVQSGGLLIEINTPISTITVGQVDDEDERESDQRRQNAELSVECDGAPLSQAMVLVTEQASKSP